MQQSRLGSYVTQLLGPAINYVLSHFNRPELVYKYTQEDNYEKMPLNSISLQFT